jgi:hypothetical protein
LHTPGDQVRDAANKTVEPRCLHTATFVTVYQSGPAQRDESPGHTIAGFADLKPRDILAASSQRLTAPGNELLCPAESGQAADQEFRLSFAAAKAAREVKVGQRSVHRASVNA